MGATIKILQLKKHPTKINQMFQMPTKPANRKKNPGVNLKKVK